MNTKVKVVHDTKSFVTTIISHASIITKADKSFSHNMVFLFVIKVFFIASVRALLQFADFVICEYV